MLELILLLFTQRQQDTGETIKLIRKFKKVGISLKPKSKNKSNKRLFGQNRFGINNECRTWLGGQKFMPEVLQN